MRLSRRLLLLILLCLLPLVGAGLLTLGGLYMQRRDQLDQLARREAELANDDIGSMVAGTHALLAGLAGGGLLATADCPARLTALREELAAYSFLAVVEPGGRIACAAPQPNDGALDPTTGWLQPLLGGPGFRVGGYAADPRFTAAPFLPFGYRPARQDSAPTLIAALDLRWLQQHLAETQADAPLAGSAIEVLDREGILLARAPIGGATIGAPVGPDAMAIITARAPGLLGVRGPDGRRRVLAYAPVTVPPGGLVVAAGFYPPDLLSDVYTAVHRGALLGGLATLIAAAIGYAAARRFVQRPIGRLLEAARAWRRGDFAARVDVGGDESEFGRLAQDFNQMAADLEARVHEHVEQAHLLEQRVAERTRELSETNNRLQVEIAERERTESVLHRAQKLQAVGQLAGGVAHDFNNLLATILGNLELMERRASGDERLQRLITRAMDAVQRGSQLTARLLAFSRRQRLTPRPTDINRLLTDLVGLASSTLGRRIRIETRLAADLWLAMADPSQVEAAVLHLALNARDAMENGGVLTLATANQIVEPGDPDAEPGAYVALSVADTGTGMSPEVQARAFEPFFTTKDYGQGSGLGLSQVYGVAQQSGGAVRLTSAPGRGTTVTLLLPRAPEHEPATLPAAGSPRRKPRNELVLLVDDDADVRQVSVEMLHDLGYEVVEAANGDEALATVRRLAAPPALLILDYAMPGMNGLRLAAELRALGIVAPLLLATGFAEFGDDRAGVAPDAVLHKPFSLAALDSTLQRLRARPIELA